MQYFLFVIITNYIEVSMGNGLFNYSFEHFCPQFYQIEFQMEWMSIIIDINGLYDHVRHKIA